MATDTILFKKAFNGGARCPNALRAFVDKPLHLDRSARNDNESIRVYSRYPREKFRIGWFSRKKPAALSRGFWFAK
jgi:hypothetical protein